MTILFVSVLYVVYVYMWKAKQMSTLALYRKLQIICFCLILWKVFRYEQKNKSFYKLVRVWTVGLPQKSTKCNVYKTHNYYTYSYVMSMYLFSLVRLLSDREEFVEEQLRFVYMDTPLLRTVVIIHVYLATRTDQNQEYRNCILGSSVFLKGSLALVKLL